MKVKSLITAALAGMLAIASVLPASAEPAASPAAAEALASPTAQKILVDGIPTDFRAYNIDGYNHFMLRDLAAIFNGTKAQFEVGWDPEAFAISLETGRPYSGTGPGFNMETPHVPVGATLSRALIYINGEQALMQGYNIDGYTYFKLRDVGSEMGFGVAWDEETRTVGLVSDPVPEASAPAIAATTEAQKQAMREAMLVLINEARLKEGLQPLVLDTTLTEMAEYKTADMDERGDLSHDGSYGSLADLLVLFDVDYLTAGENILKRGASAQDMFNIWWNSLGHRANMMHPDYRKIGIGFEDMGVATAFYEEVPDDLAHAASYNPLTGMYYCTTMSYWAAQEFTN